MSRFSDALKFESWRGKQFWDAIRDDPQRLLTGAFDPIGTKIYNEVSGDNLEPLGNQLGAPTEDQYAKAEARGMNTSGARSMNDIAQLVAAIYGGQALAGAAGVGGAAAGGTGSGGIATTAEAGGFGVGAGGAAGYNGGIAGGMSGGVGGGSAAGAGNWAQYAKMAGAGGQPTPAPQYGSPAPTQTQPFRDTFQEQQRTERRKRLARALIARGGK